MTEQQEREPLLGFQDREDGAADRRSSIVSFGKMDPENPLEWSKKYKWFSVGLLCMFAALVYGTTQLHYLPLDADSQTGPTPASESFLWLAMW